MTAMLIGPLLQRFFTDHLRAQRRVSLETIASYRDTFRLLLQFVQREMRIEPVDLSIASLDADRVLAFLESVERDRHNSIATRNLRLTAIRSFFRMVALREPSLVGLATRIAAIPMKRTDTKVREYVTRKEMDALLASLDRTRWCGRRDYALLLTMYNVGARVSEIAGLRRQHVAFGATCYVQLHGKGRKERTIPLWPTTTQVLKEWFRETQARDDDPAFPGIRGAPLTRFAIHLVLQKAVRSASRQCPSLVGKKVSPHLIRHGTAMALLQAGIDITVIAMWLGHESIETTNVYMHANLSMKEKALAKLQPIDTSFRRFRPDDRLLAFLEAL
jgi:site-specific recombinase XerD